MPKIFDFSILSRDGTDFEQLIRELCNALGYRAWDSGKGTDGGADLIVLQPVGVDFGTTERRWLVSCKDFAGSGRSVGKADVSDAPGLLAAHQCHGFLLATTTSMSSGAVDLFKGWHAGTPGEYHFWDGTRLTMMLQREEAKDVRRAFFADDTGSSVEAIAAPTVPKDPDPDGPFVATPVATSNTYYLSNGVIGLYFQTRGEDGEYDVASVHDYQIREAHRYLTESLPQGMDFAIRVAWWDDKYSNIFWAVDLDRAANPFIESADRMGERLSTVLAFDERPGGVPNRFEFNLTGKTSLDRLTPRRKDETDLNFTHAQTWDPGESLE